jgi:hypothetical protein
VPDLILSAWLLDQVVALDHYYDWGLLLSGIPLCLISRAANVFPLARLVNTKRRHKITFNMQVNILRSMNLHTTWIYMRSMNLDEFI